MNTVTKLHHLNAWERTAAGGAGVVSSGISGLDELLPAGGWPRHGVVEIIVPDMLADAMGLVLPVLRRLGQQGRMLALVTPPFEARASLYADAEINANRVLQVNPHPGRSALWTVESLLETGACAAVLAWPGCNTELMGKRLRKAAAAGRCLGILFRYAGLATRRSAVDLRLRLDVTGAGRVLYRVNGNGETLAGISI
ncbi:MAG: SulA-like leucine-rich domain-containing protein [Pseudomonadota bacterium]